VNVTRPFVGRQLEVELLLDRMAAAERGDGGVVLVSGTAGIGKTRLVEEALARQRDAAGPFRVGRGVCSDDRGTPPLWPWNRALRAVRGTTDGADLTATLEAALPSRVGNDPAAVAAARFQLLTAAADALLGVCAGRFVVLVLEDLHWADAESLELLRRVASEDTIATLLVVATHRDVLPDDVAAALADARRRPAVTAVSLGPLSEVEVGEFLLAVDAADAIARAPQVHRDTGGLPLLLATASDVPGAARNDLDVVVSGMLAQLSALDHEVVEVLALLGSPATPAVLAAVAGTDTPTTTAAVTAGRRAGLLGPPSDDGISFAHALLQDSVGRSVDEATAEARHGRAAEVIGERVIMDPRLAGEVAAHWRRAGQDGTSARAAAHFSELAADQAERTLAFDDVVRHLRDADASLRVAGGDDTEVAQLQVRLATAEFLAGRVAESLARCETAAAAATRAGRPDLVAAAALVVRGVTNATFSAVVERLCRSALSADLPPSVRARLMVQLAISAADSSRPGEAADIAAEALRIAETDGDPVALLDAIRAREMTLLTPQSAQERVRLGRLAVELAEPLGQSLAAVIGSGWLLRGAYELARMDLVDEAFAAMNAAAASSGQPLARWHVLRATASRAALEGRFGHARSCNLAALETARGLGDLVATGMSFAHSNEVAVLRGDPRDLLDGTQEMLRFAPSMPLMRSAHARLLLLLDRREEAFGFYEELRLEFHSMVVDVRWVAVLLHLADLAVSFNDVETADAVATRMRPWQDVPGAVGVTTTYFLGSPLRDLGRLAATSGRLNEAEGLLREAITRCLAVRARPYVALARLDLAGVLQRTGSLAEAQTLVRQAADDLRRLEMPGPLLRADRLAAAISTARHHADPLSMREREVHDLVTRAMSNREIAAQLVLSERTIESHVRSVLAKLGCANRTELIARHGSAD
jgi:DNA-binding CsgD family transcriptional regulator/tetratricopeptide (TPR) repeat protein